MYKLLAELKVSESLTNCLRSLYIFT